MVESGLSGPMDRPAGHKASLWATTVTGAAPAQHGIHTVFDIRPDGGGVQPFGAGSWNVPPLWQALARAGIATATIHAPGSSHATEWPGMVVDERFAASPHDGDREWPMPPRCVQPARLRDALRPLRVHPAELDDAAVAGLPAPALAEAVTVQAAALHVLAHEPCEMLLVAHPLASRVPGDDALVFLDTLLGHLIAAAGTDADVLVVSPGALVVASGPGFPADELRHGIAPGDVAATVLARFGLLAPGGRPLEGTRHGTLRGTDPPPPARNRPTAPIPAGAPDAERAVRAVTLAQAKGLALALLAAGDHAGAATAMEPALRQAPDDAELLLLLGQCRFFMGDGSGCLELGRALDRAAPAKPWGVMMQGAALALRGDRAGAAPLLDLAAARSAGDKPALTRLGAIALHLGETSLAKQHYEAALALPPADADSAMGLGLAHLAEGAFAEGEAMLRRSLALRFHAPALHHQLGLLYARQRRWREADGAVATALAQHPGLPGAEALRRRIRAAIHRASVRGRG